jgi:uncharacterized membrane protein
MYQYGPMPSGGMGDDMPGHGGVYMQHTDAWWGVGHLLPLLLFAVLIGVLVWGILRLTSERAAVASAAMPAAAPPASIAQVDAAGQELRLSYARGNITREEYLVRSADLGLTPGPTPEAPTQE